MTVIPSVSEGPVRAGGDAAEPITPPLAHMPEDAA